MKLIHLVLGEILTKLAPERTVLSGRAKAFNKLLTFDKLIHNISVNYLNLMLCIYKLY